MSEAPLICPITNATVEIVKMTYGPLLPEEYVGRVKSDIGGYTTCGFSHPDKVVDFFRTRKGVLKGEPAFKPAPKVTVKEPAIIQDVEEIEKQEGRDQDEAAKVGAERIIRIVRG